MTPEWARARPKVHTKPEGGLKMVTVQNSKESRMDVYALIVILVLVAHILRR